jgi:hypothetical protein
MTDGKQLSLFDRPEAIKQRTAILPEGTREVLHGELYRLFDRRAFDSRAKHEIHYEADIEYAWKDNVNLANRLLALKDSSKEEKFTAIIFFLAEIDNFKKFYHKEKKGMRTAKKYMLFEKECGEPLLVITYLLRKTMHNSVSNEEADIVAALLMRNAGYGEGKLERFYLWLLEQIGTHKQVPKLLEYRLKVRKGEFGYEKYVTDATSAHPITQEEYKRVRLDRLRRVSEVKKTISKR